MSQSILPSSKAGSATVPKSGWRNQSHRSRVALLPILAMAMFFVMLPDQAHAGADPTFDDVWTTIRDWMQGSLGKVLAGGFVITGLAAGVVRQSLMSFATGVGGGIGVYVSPDVIEEIVQASLPIILEAQIKVQAVDQFIINS